MIRGWIHTLAAAGTMRMFRGFWPSREIFPTGRLRVFASLRLCVDLLRFVEKGRMRMSVRTVSLGLCPPLPHRSCQDHLDEIPRCQSGLDAGSGGGVAIGDPGVPLLVEDCDLLQVSEVDQHLQ